MSRVPTVLTSSIGGELSESANTRELSLRHSQDFKTPGAKRRASGGRLFMLLARANFIFGRKADAPKSVTRRSQRPFELYFVRACNEADGGSFWRIACDSNKENVDARGRPTR